MGIEELTTRKEPPAGATIHPATHADARAEATIHPPGAHGVGSGAIDLKVLEDALQNTLKNYHPRLESNPRAEFYNKLKREADEYDGEFLNKHSGDLNITLIFSALFSVVASAFIVVIQPQLQPDYTQLSYDVLWMMANSSGLNPPAKLSSVPLWTGPDPTIVQVQAILFSSLAISLLVAFIAMLGKQWLARYSQFDVHVSPIDRGRDRQRKRDGMTTWGFEFVVESLPLMLQVALLLLGCALSEYLFTIDHLIAWIVIGFSTFGFLLYLSFVVAAAISYDCPFQTPLSCAIRSVFRFDSTHRMYLKRSRRWFLRVLFPRGRRRQRPQPRVPHPLPLFWGPDRNNSNDDIPLAVVGPPYPLPMPVDQEPNWEGYLLDSKGIAWMFNMSMDPDVILRIMKFIPEIIWHNDIPTTPLEKLYDTVLECFDNSSGSPVITSELRNKAYLGAKALVHLGIQRKCIGNESDTAAFTSISFRHTAIGSTHHEGDSDLEYTLGMIDCVFGADDPTPMRWDKFSFTNSHHVWMGQILPYRAWYFLVNNGTLPDDIRNFLVYSFRQSSSLPTPVMLGYLLIIGWVLGIHLGDDDPRVMDTSQRLRSQINKIYAKLVETFRDANSTAPDINKALEAMTFIAPLTEWDTATKSYELFHVVMRVPLSPAYSEEKKWKAARLALHGAYKSDKVLPWVEDPEDILSFLSHHFELAEETNNQDEPIQDALRALAYASTPATIEALKSVDPTEPTFTRGICHVFHQHKPLQLRKAALFFLPLIAENMFGAPDPVMNDSEMERLCVDWASVVDGVWGTDDVLGPALTVFLHMINSSHWRSHVVPEKWELLAHLDSVPDDSQLLARCLQNPGLVDAITTVGNPDVAVPWLKFLFLQYDQLDPKVRDRLEASVKGAQRINADNYLSMIQSELDEAEKELLGYNTWATAPEAVALMRKIDSHKAAIEFLKLVKWGG